MEIPEKAKSGIHAAFGIIALTMAVYNAGRKERKNKILAGIYFAIVGLEVGCVLDHGSLK